MFGDIDDSSLALTSNISLISGVTRDCDTNCRETLHNLITAAACLSIFMSSSSSVAITCLVTIASQCVFCHTNATHRVATTRCHSYPPHQSGSQGACSLSEPLGQAYAPNNQSSFAPSCFGREPTLLAEQDTHPARSSAPSLPVLGVSQTELQVRKLAFKIGCKEAGRQCEAFLVIFSASLRVSNWYQSPLSPRNSSFLDND